MNGIAQRRLGEYRKDSDGKRRFHLRNAPFRPRLEFSDEFIRDLESASLAVGRLDGSARVLPNPDHFIYMYLRLEAIISSQIEGTQASLMDLLQYEQERTDGHRGDDLAQVSNHLLLLKQLDARRRARPISVAELQATHARLLAGTRGNRFAGRLRHLQNWIGPEDGPVETAIFVPPPPNEVRRGMKNLVGFIQGERSLPPLVKAALAHAYFETLHPFIDGNGRLGRYLIHFVLWQTGTVEHPILYISHYLKAHQKEYYDLLQATRDDDDLESWCHFFLVATRSVAGDALAHARRVHGICDGLERQVQQALGKRAAAGLRALRELYIHPISDVNGLARATGLSIGRANDLATSMADHGLLHELTGYRRNRRFSLARYLKEFTMLEIREK